MTGVQNNQNPLNVNSLGGANGGGKPPPSQNDQLLNLQLTEALCAIMDAYSNEQSAAAKKSAEQTAQSDGLAQASAEVVVGMGKSQTGKHAHSGSANAPAESGTTGAASAGSGGGVGGIGA